MAEFDDKTDVACESNVAENIQIDSQMIDEQVVTENEYVLDLSPLKCSVQTDETNQNIQDGEFGDESVDTESAVQMVSLGAMVEIKEEPDQDEISFKPGRGKSITWSRRSAGRPPKRRGRPPKPKATPYNDYKNAFEIQRKRTRTQTYLSDDSSTDLDDDYPAEIGDPDSDGYKRPKKRNFAYRLQWRNKDMVEAMKTVLDGKQSIRGASKKFGVPYSTLKDRIHGRVQHGTKPGVKTALSPEEEEDLLRYIKDMETAGFQLRCIDVRVRAGEILTLNHGHNSPYTDCSPGHNWLAGFIKRHQGQAGLDFKKAMNRPLTPSVQKQKQICRHFYEGCEKLYRRYRIAGRPERVFCMGEMQVSAMLDSTILTCASADGWLMQPFVIFPSGSCKTKLTAVRQAYPEAFFISSPEGQVTDVILLWWLRDHFLKQLPPHVARPAVLLLDRPVHELTFQFMQIAREERIHVVAIPLPVSHLLHPIEGLSQMLERQITQRVRKWQKQAQEPRLTQEAMAAVLSRVWRRGAGCGDVAERFKDNGVFPVNPHTMTLERITAATQSMKEPRYETAPYSSDTGSFAGLNLLSTLSSQDYLQLQDDHSGNRDELSDRDDDVELDSRPATSLQRIGVRDVEEENVKTSSTSPASTEYSAPCYVEVEEDGSGVSEETRLEAELDEAAEWQEPRIHEQLASARDNRAQLSRAVQSIGGLFGQEARTLEQVTEAEVVEEIVEEQHDAGQYVSHVVNPHTGDVYELPPGVHPASVTFTLEEASSCADDSLDTCDASFDEGRVADVTGSPARDACEDVILQEPDGDDVQQGSDVTYEAPHERVGACARLTPSGRVGAGTECVVKSAERVVLANGQVVSADRLSVRNGQIVLLDSLPEEEQASQDAHRGRSSAADVITTSCSVGTVPARTLPRILRKGHSPPRAQLVLQPPPLLRAPTLALARTPPAPLRATAPAPPAPTLARTPISLRTVSPSEKVIKIVQPKGRRLTTEELRQIAAQVLPPGTAGKIILTEAPE